MGTLNGLKEKVKQILKDRCGREYERTYCHEIAAAGYANTIDEIEKRRMAEWGREYGKNALPTCHVVDYKWEQPLFEDKIIRDTDAELVVFVEEGVLFRKQSLEIIRLWASGHPGQLCFYGDEDVLREDGKRENPWLKPEWSPQLMETMFYVGGVLAVRRGALLTALSQGAELLKEGMKVPDFAEVVFNCVGGKERRRAEREEVIGHIPYVLCHHKSEADYDKYMDAYKEKAPDYLADEDEITSVIIPSKDHPEILERNIRSLVRTTLGASVEILVVDNGSNEENRTRVQSLLNELSWHKVQYIYEPMEFNFSRMCNLGAQKANGKYLLFLNDDTEAIEEGWLEILCREASKLQVGAVGAKLLYPDSDKIQHAGIVNIPMGPVHKLQFLSDDNTYYFKRNKVRINVLAVTGACLMVEAEKFREAGGFSEELPVAFNDVDLCFSLYEKGYYNEVCNDVTLYHHESLSRGDDESSEKLARLERERGKLYQRHKALEGIDPYYHPYLNHKGLDTRIEPAPQEWLKDGCEEIRVKEIQALPDLSGEELGKLRLHKGLYVRIESVGGNFCQGYSFMAGDDNACYERKLLLENEENGRTYTATIEMKLRQDLQENMPDQKNVAMCGFEVRLKGLPIGVYRMGVMAKNRVTGVIYINRCARRLHISEEY